MNQPGLFDPPLSDPYDKIAALERENVELRDRVAWLERQLEGKWRSPGKTGNKHPEHARDKYRRDTAKHKIALHIYRHGAMNNSELFEALGGVSGMMTVNAVSSRTGELVDMNHLTVLHDANGPVTRPTALGGDGQLYQITDDGVRFLRELGLSE